MPLAMLLKQVVVVANVTDDFVTVDLKPFVHISQDSLVAN